MRKSALFYDYPPRNGNVFGQGRRERIASMTDLCPAVLNGGNLGGPRPDAARPGSHFRHLGYACAQR